MSRGSQKTLKHAHKKITLMACYNGQGALVLKAKLVVSTGEQRDECWCATSSECSSALLPSGQNNCECYILCKMSSIARINYIICDKAVLCCTSSYLPHLIGMYCSFPCHILYTRFNYVYLLIFR